MPTTIEHASRSIAAALLCIDMLEFGLGLLVLEIVGYYGSWAVGSRVVVAGDGHVNRRILWVIC